MELINLMWNWPNGIEWNYKWQNWTDPMSDAHAEIRTDVVVICHPTRYQLDHGGAPSLPGMTLMLDGQIMTRHWSHQARSHEIREWLWWSQIWLWGWKQYDWIWPLGKTFMEKLIRKTESPHKIWVSLNDEWDIGQQKSDCATSAYKMGRTDKNWVRQQC